MNEAGDRAVQRAMHLGTWERAARSLAATLAIASCCAGLVVAPALIATRPAGGSWASLSTVLLGVWVATGATVAVMLCRQHAAPRRLALVPAPVQRRGRAVRELSLFGVGTLRGWTVADPEVGLDRVVTPMPPGPDITIPLALARPEPAGPATAGTGRPAPPPVHRSRPGVERSPVAEPDAVPLASLPRQAHVVRRGETWWSLAEQLLGDGRRWDELRDLNLGSPVEPDVLIDESSVLRPGWQIQVPVPHRLPTSN
jgi:hypothetical protein